MTSIGNIFEKLQREIFENGIICIKFNTANYWPVGHNYVKKSF